jgi:hypothetical protein
MAQSGWLMAKVISAKKRSESAAMKESGVIRRHPEIWRNESGVAKQSSA